MKLTRHHLPIFLAAFAMLSGNAAALPTDATSRAYTDSNTQVFLDSGGFFSDRDDLLGSTSSNTSAAIFTGDAEASVDLSTGQLKAKTSATGFTGVTEASSTGSGFGTDFLTFDRDTTISYQFAVDGILQNRSSGEALFVAGTAVRDVTDLSGEYFDGDNDVTAAAAALTVSSTLGRAEVRASANPSPPTFYDEYTEIVDVSGIPFTIGFNLSDTLSVVAGRTYAFQLSVFSNVRVPGPGMALSDFSSTAAFSFTDLGGAQFTSESGTFLSAVPSNAVPEGSVVALLLIGLGALVSTSTQRKNI